MAKKFEFKKEEVQEVLPSVEPVVEPTVEVTPEPVVEIVKEEVKPAVDVKAIVSQLSAMAETFRKLYGEQLNPVFAEIHKSLANAQYKIMQSFK